MKTSATNLLTNKTLTKVIRFWPVYDGQSMTIDNNGNQSYVQNWGSFVSFGFDYVDKFGYHTDCINRDNMTELEYVNLLTLAVSNKGVKK